MASRENKAVWKYFELIDCPNIHTIMFCLTLPHKFVGPLTFKLGKRLKGQKEAEEIRSKTIEVRRSYDRWDRDWGKESDSRIIYGTITGLRQAVVTNTVVHWDFEGIGHICGPAERQDVKGFFAPNTRKGYIAIRVPPSI